VPVQSSARAAPMRALQQDPPRQPAVPVQSSARAAPMRAGAEVAPGAQRAQGSARERAAAAAERRRASTMQHEQEPCQELLTPCPEATVASAAADRGAQVPTAKLIKRAAVCPVCFEDGGRMVAFECAHEACEACVSKMARIQVDEGNVDGLRCIECSEALPPLLVESVLQSSSDDSETADEYVRRYRDLLLRRFVRDSASRIVYCPAAACEFAFECEEGTDGTIDCPCCGTQMSLQVDATDDGPEETDEMRRCPKCTALIEKDPGTCDKMQCHCGYRFCFRCGAENAQCACTAAFHQFWDNHNNRPVPHDRGPSLFDTMYAANNFHGEW